MPEIRITPLRFPVFRSSFNAPPRSTEIKLIPGKLKFRHSDRNHALIPDTDSVKTKNGSRRFPEEASCASIRKPNRKNAGVSQRFRRKRLSSWRTRCSIRFRTALSG